MTENLITFGEHTEKIPFTAAEIKQINKIAEHMVDGSKFAVEGSGFAYSKKEFIIGDFEYFHGSFAKNKIVAGAPKWAMELDYALIWGLVKKIRRVYKDYGTIFFLEKKSNKAAMGIRRLSAKRYKEIEEQEKKYSLDALFPAPFKRKNVPLPKPE